MMEHGDVKTICELLCWYLGVDLEEYYIHDYRVRLHYKGIKYIDFYSLKNFLAEYGVVLKNIEYKDDSLIMYLDHELMYDGREIAGNLVFYPLLARVRYDIELMLDIIEGCLDGIKVRSITLSATTRYFVMCLDVSDPQLLVERVRERLCEPRNSSVGKSNLSNGNAVEGVNNL